MDKRADHFIMGKWVDCQCAIPREILIGIKKAVQHNPITEV